MRNELHHLRSEVFTFLSYGYAVHARKGVEASSEVTTEHIHQPQDHEVERLRLYRKLEDLLSQPDLFDESATQDEFWTLYEPSSMYVHRQRDQWWS